MKRAKKGGDNDLHRMLVEMLLPIGRLMVRGGLGFGDLVHAAKHAYVRAAISTVAPAGSRINASRLSVITGLTRKDVTAVVTALSGRHRTRAKLTKEQPARRVLRGWECDRRYCDERGIPAALPIRGGPRSFSSLVRDYGGDVTPRAVLKELERLDAVTFNSTNGLRIRLSGATSEAAHRIALLSRALPDFANTVAFQGPANGHPLFFRFKDAVVQSPKDAVKFQTTFSNRGAHLLAEFDRWMSSRPRRGRGRRASAEHVCRVGIGVYLVQGDRG